MSARYKQFQWGDPLIQERNPSGTVFFRKVSQAAHAQFRVLLRGHDKTFSYRIWFPDDKLPPVSLMIPSLTFSSQTFFLLVN